MYLLTDIKILLRKDQGVNLTGVVVVGGTSIGFILAGCTPVDNELAEVDADAEVMPPVLLTLVTPVGMLPKTADEPISVYFYC